MKHKSISILEVHKLVEAGVFKEANIVDDSVKSITVIINAKEYTFMVDGYCFKVTSEAPDKIEDRWKLSGKIGEKAEIVPVYYEDEHEAREAIRGYGDINNTLEVRKVQFNLTKNKEEL